MEPAVDFTPGFEAQYRNHKVVALPSSRGRSSVRDIAAAANSAQQPQHPPIQRPRSLSAGRKRNSNSGSSINNDNMVQGIYDRMGVNLRRGQATDLNVTTTTTYSGSVVDDSGNELLPSPPRLISGGAALEAQASASEPGGGSFQERYRNAVSRGRARPEQTAAPTAAVEEELTPRRTRSFSASRIGKRWPPEAPSNGGSSMVEEPIHQSGANILRPVAHSPPNSRRGGPPPARGLSPKLPAPTPIEATSPSPSWIQNHPSNNNSNGTYEEKKEDHAEPMDGNAPVSIKDRIGAYGKPGGSLKSSLRKVDPNYAAQFAVRDLPPKIDIYAEKNQQQPQQSAPVEDRQEFNESNQLPYGGNQQIAAPLNTVSTQESTGLPAYPMAGDEYEQPAPPQQQQQQPSRQGLSPIRGPVRQSSKSNLANAFLAAINKQPAQSNNIPPQAPTSHKVPTLPPTNAPVVEINVSRESGEMGGMNDVNSVTGLSTVSGEEFSAAASRGRGGGYGDNNYKKPTWQRASSFTGFNRGVPRKPVGTSNNHSNHPSNSYGATTAAPPPSSTMMNSEIERLVEERVQSRVAELELEIEHKLRALVGQMEDKIMLRLDTLETKMTAAVTKKK
mmetsp:Transcript_14170/g.30923  ORF Transcript_14170/g.30923 Transcript_14170/m.30923 type:complete len:616 (+) Transcript_14170:77-1924(+)